MADLSGITTGIDLAKSGWALLEYVRSIAGADVIAAYFRYDGTRVEGSDKIDVELHHVEREPSVWWFSVKPLSDYAFVREPVTPSCANELVGQITGEALPDSRYWRWVAPVLPGRIYGGGSPPNLKVDFMVFGYRPKALLKHFGGQK
jgi:hypothetical protein